MRLYLVQHGEALPKEVDPDRPLGDAGRRDVQEVARFLAAAGIRVDGVAHSGKRRAEQTATLIAEALGANRLPEARSGLDPNDPVEVIATDVKAAEKDVMLVGHLPFMAKLATHLLAGREEPPAVGFVPGTVAALERTADGGFVLAWMIRPELVGGA